MANDFISAKNTATATVSQETLEETPARVMKFLYGVGTVPAIRARLARRGYTPEEHQRGWSLLHAASGYELEPALGTHSDPEVLAAVSELDDWDEDGFRIIHAALGRLHPAQDRAVLAGLAPARGAGSVLSVKLLLDRLDTLDKSQDAGDKAATKTLATRGITQAERKRLRGLIAIAEKGTSQPAPDTSARDAQNEKRQQALVELRAWYEDWSNMARALVKRRDRLIRLGLAKRRSPRKRKAEPAPAATDAPAS